MGFRTVSRRHFSTADHHGRGPRRGRYARAGIAVIGAGVLALTLVPAASAAPADSVARGSSAAVASARVVAAQAATAASPSRFATPEHWWVSPVSGSAAVCPTVFWGSLQKSSRKATSAPITEVRAGRHGCYDRIVIDLGSGKTPGYTVRYADEVRQEGSGKRVWLRGGASLEVVVRAPAYNASTGRATYRPGNSTELINVEGFATLRQVAFGGSFEGQTTIGVGLRARLPFRVFTLDGPGSAQRLVIDIAHHW